MKQWLRLTPGRRRLAAGIAVTLVMHGLIVAGVLTMKSTLEPVPSAPVIEIVLETWDVRQSLPVARPIIQKSQMVTREEPAEGVLDFHDAKIILPETETHNLSSDQAAGSDSVPAGETGQGTGDADYWPPGLNPMQEALHFGNYCRGQQSRGEKPHPSCGLDDLASLSEIGPRDPDGVMARKDREQQYRTSPGNAEYWKRVNRSPSNYRVDEPPNPGAYTNPKDQRGMSGR